MNKIIKKQTNKIIILLVIILLCNFIMPARTYALNGGLFFKPIAQFIARIADLVIQGFQLIFIGDGSIQFGPNQYLIRYSPGIIFSGMIPAFDTNFINPDPDYEVKVIKGIAGEGARDYTYTLEELGRVDFYGEDNLIWTFLEQGTLYDGEGKTLLQTEPLYTEDNSLQTIYDQGWTTSDGVQVRDILQEENVDVSKIDDTELDNYVMSGGNDGFTSATVGPVTYNGVEYKSVYLTVSLGDWTMPTENVGNIEIYLRLYNYDFEDYDGNYVSTANGELNIKNVTEVTYKPEPNGTFIESTAKQLRGFITTWYNVLKVVALVGLMSVLVYVAIRIILSSTAKDKAKYKKMLIDWLAAICIIFVMHYLMSFIITATDSISKIFAASVVGTHEEDVLMTNIRSSIKDKPKDFMEIFAEIVMYTILVVYTVLFTVQYLKRTIYLAFLTIISPLVALTYPLDKIKDGKAQAFSMWLKEYIYSSLIQPVHLILYCLLVNSAIDFVQEVPIYAIIVIGFFLPAEKFVKQMFGLDRANTVGTMAAAMGGASIMNAINKLGAKGPKGGAKGVPGEGGTKGEKIRTANEGAGDPYEALRNQGTGEDNSGAGNVGGGANAPVRQANQAGTGHGRTNANQGQQAPVASREGNQAPVASREGNQAPARSQGITGAGQGSKNAGKRSVKDGAKTLWNRYVWNKNTGKKVLRGATKLTTAATLGTIGLAAGIATGDMSNAVAGLTGGIMAGRRVGDNIATGVGNLTEGAKGIRDTYREGQYGKEEYERMKFDKEFKRSTEYKNLVSKYPGHEEKIQEFLNAGITDTKKMGKAMKNIQRGTYDSKKAIAYMKMAKDCPDGILHDKEKFKEYLRVRKIPIENAEEIRKGINDFK